MDANFDIRPDVLAALQLDRVSIPALLQAAIDSGAVTCCAAWLDSGRTPLEAHTLVAHGVEHHPGWADIPANVIVDYHTAGYTADTWRTGQADIRIAELKTHHLPYIHNRVRRELPRDIADKLLAAFAAPAAPVIELIADTPSLQTVVRRCTPDALRSAVIIASQGRWETETIGQAVTFTAQSLAALISEFDSHAENNQYAAPQLNGQDQSETTQQK